MKVDTVECRLPARGLQHDCCASPLRFELRAAQPDRAARATPGRARANVASITSTLDELRSKLPHVRLPRFPPVARRLREAIQGGHTSATPQACENGPQPRKRGDKHTLRTRDVRAETDVLAQEVTGGRKRVYKRRDGGHPHGSFDMIQARTPSPLAPLPTNKASSSGAPPHCARGRCAPSRSTKPTFCAVQELESGALAFRRLWASFLVPQGYPASVSPQYREYMFWRGVQYFFGGALSLFTTRALLTSVGVKRGASTSAAAINWVLKDGAGRMGRFLFARWGHQLDCELKQFRLLGDGLMEGGAILELSTIAFPRQFLLLACTANLMKNLAAVAASSTRAPIYRTFALQNNMADVTAKGESVANLSDIVGVAVGIALSKLNWHIATTFALLSCGYLFASRMEVDSVVLPFMNQVRRAPATAPSAAGPWGADACKLFTATDGRGALIAG